MTASPTRVVATRVATVEVTWSRIELQVTFTNPSDASVFVHRCMHALERAVPGNAWAPAVRPNCRGPQDWLEIPSGGQRVEQAFISGAIAGPGGPSWEGGPVAGTYRLTYAIVHPPSDERTALISSSVFEVSE